MTPTWQPLFRDDAAACTQAAVREIAVRLGTEPLRILDPVHGHGSSLASGAAGAALFFGYLAELTQLDEHIDRAATLLDHAIENALPGLSLFGGLPGIQFVSDHINARFGEPELDVDAAHNELSPVDGLLIQDNGHYDLISGIVGRAVCALERPRSASTDSVLAEIVRQLSGYADRGWWTPPALLPEHQREVAPEGYLNLGLAHGLPGAVAVLGRLVAALPSPACQQLLSDSVALLLDHQLPRDVGAGFDAYFTPERQPTAVRTAWCYGDPGVAMAMLVAARGAGNAQWEQFAIELARSCIPRSQQEARVSDAGLCHGSAGLGHFFNRFYQATGQEEFADAARQWLLLALELPTHSDGLLTGAAGVGLALLAGLAPAEPGWDSAMLMKVPG